MVTRSRHKNLRRFLAKIPTFEFICVYLKPIKSLKKLHRKKAAYENIDSLRKIVVLIAV